MRNDKFDVDALIRYGANRVRAIRKTPAAGELRAPQTLDQFAAYDVIILGRAVDSLLDALGGRRGGLFRPASLLDQYVSERGGTVIFSRGRAFTNASAGELEPVLWGGKPRERVHLDVTAEGRALLALSRLERRRGRTGGAAGFARRKNAAGNQAAGLHLRRRRPDAMIRRRRRRSFTGVTGAARSSASAWPACGAGRMSVQGRGRQFALRPVLGSDGFVAAGRTRFHPQPAVFLSPEFRQHSARRKSLFPPGHAPARSENKVRAGHDLLRRRGSRPGQSHSRCRPAAGRLSAEFLPERPGRYRAAVNLPDGTTQESRFIVFTENLEETEVATDTLYLRRLCESSGGRLIAAAELPRLLKELRSQKADTDPADHPAPGVECGLGFLSGGVVLRGGLVFAKTVGLMLNTPNILSLQEKGNHPPSH